MDRKVNILVGGGGQSSENRYGNAPVSNQQNTYQNIQTSGDGGGKKHGGVSSTVIIALSILGAGLLISLAIFDSIVGPHVVANYQQQRAAAEVQQQYDQSRLEGGIRAFIADGADEDNVEAFRHEVESWDEVVSVDLTTKEEAYEEYSTLGQADEEAIDALGDNNPFPASFRIYVKTVDDIDVVAERIKNDETFEKIADMGDVNSAVSYQ